MARAQRTNARNNRSNGTRSRDTSAVKPKAVATAAGAGKKKNAVTKDKTSRKEDIRAIRKRRAKLARDMQMNVIVDPTLFMRRFWKRVAHATRKLGARLVVNCVFACGMFWLISPIFHPDTAASIGKKDSPWAWNTFMNLFALIICYPAGWLIVEIGRMAVWFSTCGGVDFNRKVCCGNKRCCDDCMHRPGEEDEYLDDYDYDDSGDEITDDDDEDYGSGGDDDDNNAESDRDPDPIPAVATEDDGEGGEEEPLISAIDAGITLEQKIRKSQTPRQQEVTRRFRPIREATMEDLERAKQEYDRRMATWEQRQQQQQQQKPTETPSSVVQTTVEQPIVVPVEPSSHVIM